MGWFERQKNKEEADKESGAHLPENEFEQSEPKFHFLFDNMRSGVVIYQVINDGEDFIIIDFNRAAEKLENVRREDVIGKNVVEVFPGIKEMGLLEVLRRVWKTGKAEFSQATLYRDPIRTGWRESYVYKLPSGEIVAIYDDVTERKRSELALRMGEQRFRAIADYTYHWESWVGPTGTLFWVNPAVERITGYTVEECMKMADYPMPFIHEADRETMTDILREARKGGVGKDVEFRIRRKDGKIIWGEIAWQGIYDNKGVYQGYRASIDDITERALAQEALKVSEERLKLTTEAGAIGTWDLDLVSGKLIWDAKCKSMHGFAPAKEITFEMFLNAVHPDNRHLVEQSRSQRTAEHSEFEIEYRTVWLDGSIHWIYAKGRGMFDEDGRCIRISGVTIDITERKRAEEAIRQSEEKFRTLHVISPIAIVLNRLDNGQFLESNQALWDMTGYTEEEFRKLTYWDITPIDYKEMEAEQLRLLHTVGRYGPYEKEYIRKDGTRFPVLLSGVRIKDPSGTDLIYSVIQDITELKAKENAIKEREERYRALVENVELGIMMMDLDHTILAANSGVGKLFGKGVSEIIGKKCDELFAGEDAKIFGSCPGDIALEKCERVVVEKEGIRADGSRFAARVQAFPVYPKGELSAYFIEVVEDITEDKLSQEKLRESERRYSSFVQNFNGIAFRAKSDFTPIFIHGMVHDITGYTDEEFTSGKVRWEQIIHPDDMRLAYDGETKKLQMVPGFSSDKEYRIIRKDGAVRWVHHRAQNQAGEDGKVAYIQGTIHDITDRRAAEDALRERMKEITCLYAVSRDIQEDLSIDKLCRRAVEHLVSAMQFPEITVPVIELSGKRFTSKNYTKGLSYGLHAEIRMKDEALGHLSVYYAEEKPFLIPEEQNLVNGVAEAISMWLERKRAEEDLANLTSLLSSTIESTFSGILVVDRKGKITRFNKKFAEMWRIPESILATHDDKQALEFAVSQLSDPEGFLRKVRELYNNPERESFDIINFKDGRIFERYSGPQKIDDEIVGRVWTFHDITERRRTEEELLKGEKKYRELVETMSEGLGVADKDYVFTYVNRRFAEMLGYRQDEMTGHHLTDFLDEQNRRIMHVQMAERRAGKAGVFDLTWTAKDGHKVYTIASPKGIFDEKGNFQGSYAVLMDITERKRAEEKLRMEEQKYHEIVDSLAEGIGISDENYIWTYVNKRFAEMLGYEQDEMIGRKVTDFMDEKNRQTMAGQITKRKRGVSEPYDVAWVAKDGHRVYTMVSPKGIYDEEGNFRASFGLLVDITERRKAEEERESLFKAIEQKNKELESILYVASHDLKSALLSIESLGNDLKESCELVKLVLADRLEQLDEKSRDVLDRDIPETVKSILSSAGKMEILLGGLLRLSHAGSATLNVERLDMNKILAEIVESFEQQMAEEKISVEIEELPWCMGDVSLIKEVFSSLLDNALKYLDDSRRGMVRVWGKVEDGQSVYCIEDNGIGIAREHYEKIFDMFYQLEHGKKRGEGLGLTIVRRILDRHKGRVWVASEVGKGSRFYVSLSRER